MMLELIVSKAMETLASQYVPCRRYIYIDIYIYIKYIIYKVKWNSPAYFIEYGMRMSYTSELYEN